MNFSTFAFSDPILQAISEQGYTTPTPIQIAAIPAVLKGQDLMAAAETGTGKTASFILPLLQRLTTGPKVKSNHVRVLVLTPTRELAQQLAENTAVYGRHLKIKSAAVYGGVKINPQMMKLRGGVDLLVATPGRLLDLHEQNAIRFGQIETLVLDEADRMLDMGFSDEIGKIMKILPKRRQNLLFSATFSDEIRTLSKFILNNPQLIEVSPRNSPAKSVKQWVYEVDKSKKSELLSQLIDRNDWTQVLVFTKTKKGADDLVRHLKSDNISAAAIHGDKSQGVRARVLSAFKTNKLRILVATDVAARGLDINELPLVVNFDLPKVAEDYIHRIGRTGRAGLSGQGISLVSADEVKSLADIESLIQETLVREVETDFVPTHKVPLTRQTKVRPKKPKKVKVKEETAQDGGWTAKGQKKYRNKDERRGRRGQRMEPSSTADQSKQGRNSRATKSKP
jgi:ATP-dependent RNA helicase RhlE